MSLISNNFEFGEPERNAVENGRGVRSGSVDLGVIQGITESRKGLGIRKEKENINICSTRKGFGAIK